MRFAIVALSEEDIFEVAVVLLPVIGRCRKQAPAKAKAEASAEETACASSTGSNAEEAAVAAMQHFMEDECGIAVDYGAWFGGGEYAGCIRVNLATCRENIETAADRIINALKES